MMNDPLLPPPPPPSTASRRITPKKTRRPGVANSAKILATGLATTATLGLTAGYALASKTQPEQNPAQGNGQQSTSLQTPLSPAVTTPPVATAPVVTAPTAIAPTVTNPPVVEIPVPTVAPAQPGNNWGNSGSNQPSSGSR